MKRFSDSVIIYLGSGMVASVLQVIVSMVLVRHLSKYDFGTFRQIMLISVLISTTIAIGLPQSLSYFIPRAATDREKKQLAFQVFSMLTLLALGIAAISYLLRYKISEIFNNPDLTQYAWVFSFYFLFLIPSKCTQPTLVAFGRTNFAAALNAGTAIFNFVFVLIPLLLGKDLRFIFLSMLLVYILKFLIVVIILSSLKGGIPKIFDFTSMKEQFLYGLPLGGALILGVTRKYIDQFIIAAFYNPVNFAVYSRGAFELPFVNLLPYSISNLTIPKFAQYHKENNLSAILYLWQESMRKVSLVMFPIFIYSFIFADLIITLLFTKEYLDSVPVFRIYLLLLPLRVVAYRSILQAIGKTKPILTATIISLIISVIFGIIFEKLFGMVGPAMGVVLGLFFAPMFLLLQTKKYLKVALSDLVPLKKLYHPMLCAVFVGMLTYPVRLLDLPALPALVLTGFFYSMTYIFMMKYYDIFSKSEWDLICRWTRLGFLSGK